MEKTSKVGERVWQQLPQFPQCQLFKVHGNKLKPHPSGNLGQTSIKRIKHAMLYFFVGKDSLNGFFVFSIKAPVFRSVSGIVGQFFVILPDMAQDSLHAVLGTGTQMPGGTFRTNLWIAFVLPVPITVGGTIG